VAFRCDICGNAHDGLPDVAYRWPDHYFGIPEPERNKRIHGTTDICSIDDEDFFVRGVILIPIKNSKDSFGLGVWVSQKRENFKTYLANFDSAEIGPFFGWLCNRIPFYDEDTLALKTMAHFQGNNQRPLIKLEPSEHPLYMDYAEGVTLDRAWAIMHSRNQIGDT
jgi:hypothetical protein